MLTAESALALFSMLAISSIALFFAQRLRVPHTVLLVAIGIVLGFLSLFPYFHFLAGFSLTPDLLFFIFLPILIFDCAYNMNIRHLTHDGLIIGILSVVSLVISAFLIAVGLDITFTLIGLGIPFILSLVFGAIISATDPVAVLALFKEYGAPRRLSLIFEGESIFNDGTSVALFLVVLAIAQTGNYGMTEIFEGTYTFIAMVVGGIVFGLIFGGIFARLISYTRENEFASITLTMVLAHTTFICAELVTRLATDAGLPLHISPIIATTTSSLFMGNYGRYRIAPHLADFVERYWSQFAFLSNSLIFLLIGMFIIKLPAAAPVLFLPIILCILIVAGSRALSIYPVVRLFNWFAHPERQVPRSWQHVLAWGSLRGALAVTMVLMIPDALSFPGWGFEFTPKELLLTLTVSCIFATLFIKATTIGSFMKRFELNTFSKLEEVNYGEMLVHIYDSSLGRLRDLLAKEYIDRDTHAKLMNAQMYRLEETLANLLAIARDPLVFEKVIRLHAIGIERKHAKVLYGADEVPEDVVKHIMAKLDYQSHAVEFDIYDETVYEHGYPPDVFEILGNWVARLTHVALTPDAKTRLDYFYYRALSILSQKVVEELSILRGCFGPDFSLPQVAIDKVCSLYDKYSTGAARLMREIRLHHPTLISELDLQLGRRLLYQHEHMMLANLREREMVTPRVSIALADRFAGENR